MRRLLIVVAALLPASFAFAADPPKEPKLARVIVAGRELGQATTSRGRVVETVKVNLELANKTMLGVEVENVKDALKPSKDQELNTYVAEGVLRVGDPWPSVDFPPKPGTKQLWLRGTGRYMTKEDKARFPSKGNAIVEGKAVTDRYDLDDEKTSLAIQNGKDLIYVTGKAAKDLGKLKGTIRVTGQLKLDEKGRTRIVAKKVEANKK